jgi:AAA15 family ATPase/GTPase
VQNFRSIRNKITLDFRATSDKHQEEYFVFNVTRPKTRILKMAMIYGANASGKSSILIALDFLRRLVLNPVQDKNNSLNIPFFALDTEKTSEFEIEFYCNQVIYEYHIVLDNHKIHFESLFYYPKGKRAKIFTRELTGANEYTYDWSENLFKKMVQEQLELSIPNQAIIAKIASIDYSGPLQMAHDWFRFKLQAILLPNMSLTRYTSKQLIEQNSSHTAIKKFIVEFLRKADFLISDIKIDEESVGIEELPMQIQRNMSTHGSEVPRIIRYDFGFIHESKDGSFTLDIEQESLGTQRFYGLGAILMSLISGGVTMPIDEIEGSLHNDLLFHFIAMFLRNSEQGQLIFTSHNTSLMHEKSITRRDCIWITDRKSDGSTELTPVSDYPVRKEHAIDSLFKKGLIGGKPNLGPIYLENVHE